MDATRAPRRSGLEIVRNSLLCFFLGLLSVAVGKSLYLLDQASITLTNIQAVVATVGPPLTGAVIEFEGAAREQRRYYKATGKALFLATRDFDRLVRNTDERSAKVLAQAQNMLKVTQDAVALVGQDSHEIAEATRKQVEENGYEARLALAAARGNFEQMESLWPILRRGAENTAQAAENLEHSTESIKIALEPLRKPTSRLKWILQWLLGLPKISVR